MFRLFILRVHSTRQLEDWDVSANNFRDGNEYFIEIAKGKKREETDKTVPLIEDLPLPNDRWMNTRKVYTYDGPIFEPASQTTLFTFTCKFWLESSTQIYDCQ